MSATPSSCLKPGQFAFTDVEPGSTFSHGLIIPRQKASLMSVLQLLALVAGDRRPLGLAAAPAAASRYLLTQRAMSLCGPLDCWVAILFTNYSYINASSTDARQCFTGCVCTSCYHVTRVRLYMNAGHAFVPGLNIRYQSARYTGARVCAVE